MTDLPDISGILWPLRRGETLSNHDWWPFWGHRFLDSEMVSAAVLEDRRADLGTAIILRAASMRQDPAGTLPVSDLALAGLARFPSVAAWQAARAGALDGWVPVDVEDEAGGTIRRLGHPETLSVVVDMMGRAKARTAARTAGADRKKAERIRRKLRGLGLPRHVAESEDIVARLVRHFNLAEMFVTDENIRAALSDVIGLSGDVVPLGRANSPNRSKA